jgi:hypothetical protein
MRFRSGRYACNGLFEMVVTFRTYWTIPILGKREKSGTRLRYATRATANLSNNSVTTTLESNRFV